MNTTIVRRARRKPATPVADFGQALVPFDLQDEGQRRGTQILRNFFSYLPNKNTRRSYAEDLRVFIPFMRGIYHGKLSPAQAVDFFLFGGQSRAEHFAHANAVAEAFRQWQERLDKSSGTIYRRLAMLRGLSAAARRLGFITWRVEVRSPRRELRRDTRGPAVDDVSRLFDHLARLGTPVAIRDAAIVHLLHDLGLRRNEVATLDVSHLNFHTETVAVVGKGRRERELLNLPQPTQHALRAWLEVRGPSPGALFLLARPNAFGQRQESRSRFRLNSRISGCAIYKQVRAYGEELGIRLRPHGFRHTAITSAMIAAAERRIPFEEVMMFSRHASIGTLMRYRDFLMNRQPELAAAVAARLKPRTSKKGGQR